MNRMLLAVLSFPVLVALGCGGPSPVPAGGTITYQGKPVANANVTFIPKGADTAQRPMATGRTDEQGKFTLTTSQSGDGAVPGEYTVTVSLAQEAATEGDYSLPTEPPFPARYADVGVSDLSATVKSGDGNQFNLELKDA